MTEPSHISQANDAGIEAELLDPDSGSDKDEDAEAKLLRLRQAAGSSRAADVDTAAAAVTNNKDRKRSQRMRAKRKAENAAAEDTQKGKEWQGIVASTEGPTSIDTNAPDIALNGNSPGVRSRDGSAEQLEQPAPNGKVASAAEIILRGRADILTSQARQQNGKAALKSSGKRKPVSIGPLLQISTAIKRDSDAEMDGEEAAAPTFIKSKSFSGEKAGYRFSKGKLGMGYYLDKDTRASTEQNQKRRRSEVGSEEDGAEVDDVLQDIATGVARQHGSDQIAGTGEALDCPAFDTFCILILFVCL